MQKLTKLEQMIVVAHVMRRITSHFKTHERTSAIEVLLKRLRKFLLQKERKNKKSFIFATEFEKVLWLNVTDKYDKKTKILALDFVSSLFAYFESDLDKYANITQKVIQKIDINVSNLDISSTEAYEMEQNDNDLLSTFITMFKPYSGIGLKKSLFAGKKLTIKNNLILEGKKIASGF